MYMIWFIDVLNVKGTLISNMFYCLGCIFELNCGKSV